MFTPVANHAAHRYANPAKEFTPCYPFRSGGRAMFKDDFWQEWRRLNPRCIRPEDGLRVVFFKGFHAGLFGYFAPLRMLWWLLKQGANRVFYKGPTK
jgi:hypothetical protein